jgi:hypothetical protein
VRATVGCGGHISIGWGVNSVLMCLIAFNTRCCLYLVLRGSTEGSLSSVLRGYREASQRFYWTAINACISTNKNTIDIEPYNKRPFPQ